MPVREGRGHTAPMGFNPYRKHRRSPADLAMVIGAVLVVLLLLAWAIAG